MPDASTTPAITRPLLNVEAILQELKSLDFSNHQNPDLVVKALASLALNETHTALETLETS